MVVDGHAQNEPGVESQEERMSAALPERRVIEEQMSAQICPYLMHLQE
jgi:hypothetical protein